VKATSYLFLARDLSLGEQELEEDEQIEVVKIPLEKAVEKVISGEITGSATMIGILMLDKLRREKKI
jgi:ADP-ribose pyrophosphatase